MGLWAVEVRGRDLAGRTIRTGPGAWRESSSTATECPDFGVYLTGKPPADPGWEFRWVNWPDFRVPSSTSKAVAALRETHQRAASERVEICLRRWHGSDRNCFGITCRSKWTAGREDVPCHGFGSITDAGRSKHRGSAVGSSTLQWQSGAIFTEGPSTATPRSGRHKGNAERDRLVDPANTAPEETLAVSQYGPCETDRIKTDH